METITSGAQLAAIRHRLGLSLSELGEQLDINERTIRAWETSSSEIRPGPMADIAALADEQEHLVDQMVAAGGAWIPRRPSRFPRGWFVAAAARALEENPGIEVEWFDDVLEWGEVKVERLELADAWGKAHRVTVFWIPEEITGYDAGLENLHRREWHLDGECPVQLVRAESGHVRVQAIKRVYQGSDSRIVESKELPVGVKLSEGTHMVVES